MRDPNRIDGILARIGRAWKRNPDMRLGQLIANLNADVFYIEDSDLARLLELHVAPQFIERRK